MVIHTHCVSCEQPIPRLRPLATGMCRACWKTCGTHKPRLGHTWKWSDEVKAKIGLSHKGSKRSLESRKRMSVSVMGNKRNLGRKMPQHVKDALKKANVGRPRTEHEKEFLRALMIGNTYSKGRVVSMEERLRRSGLTGEKSALWRGGVSARTERDRHSHHLRVWSRAVVQRDGKTCQICGSQEMVQADHIKPFAFYPELRLELSNGRALCMPCHKSYGWKPTKENLAKVRLEGRMTYAR